MGFIKKLFNPFSEEEKDPKENGLNAEETAGTPSRPVADEVSPAAPVVDTCSEQSTVAISDIGLLAETVKELILNSVAPYTGKDDFVGLSIWVNDQIYHALSTEKFKADLRAAFDSMRLFSLGKSEISIIHGEPTQQDKASPLTKKGIIPKGILWIRLIEKGAAEPKHVKASVSVFQGLGSCKEKEYILSSEDKPVYRIGRGTISRKPGSSYRVNDIIVEDNNPDPGIQKMNNYVSSAQADIILDDGYFYLRAMPSGCRTQGGSPTKVIRDQEAFELRDSVSSFKLKDGDVIEMGKSVLLQFKIIE